MNAPAKSPAKSAAAVQATSTLTLLRTLSVVSAICGLIIVASYLATLDRAKANRRLAAERAVFKVLPDARTVKDYLALPSGDIVPAGGGDPPPGALRFYAAYDGNGHFAGIAAEGGAKGYADMVRVMFGYSEPCHCIVGIGVVSMRETPGIGDRNPHGQGFSCQFQGAGRAAEG